MGKPVPIEELKRLYLDEKLSVPEIASRLGLSPQRVYERFRENGISLRTGLSKEELTDLYQNQKRTIKEIAKQTGYSVFTVRRYLDQYEIPRPKRRASATPVPVHELERLYLDERLSVPEIATRVGVHRNAVYVLLREYGISLRPRLSKEELTELYENQKLTIREIAKRTGCIVATVSKYLQRYEIPRSYRRGSKPPRRVSKYNYIESLAVGDQIKVVTDSGRYPTRIFEIAKDMGIRIIAKRLDKNTFLIIRIPS